MVRPYSRNNRVFKYMDILDRYVILHEVGSGGMATVYCAQDTLLSRKVAIKMIHPHLLERIDAIKRFRTEAQAIASLAHENIIKVFDYGEEHDKHFLIMEFIDGVPLNDLLEKHTILPDVFILEMMCQILSGIQAAHEQGIIHRDIKPANIMIDKSGYIRIMDFGIAYLVNKDSITVTGTFVGSPSYISPEQAEGKKVDGKTDVFSLASLIYECLAGKQPFERDNSHAVIRAIIDDESEPVFRHNPEVLFWLSDLVASCMRKDPACRPDAGEALNRIETQCRQDQIRLGKHRITDFLVDPVSCKNKEKAELFEIYCNKARSDFNNKKQSSCIRNLNQARCFGALAPEDEKLSVLLKRNNFIKKTGFLAALFLIVACSAYFLLKSVRFDFAGSFKSSDSRADTVRITHYDSTAYGLGRNSGPSSNHSEESTNPKSRSNEKEEVAAAEDFHQIQMTDLKEPSSGKREDIGFLFIRTNPPWVRIFVDGVERGETPRNEIIPLAPGKHDILLRKDGFFDFQDSIIVETFDTTNKMVKMVASEP
ncbi:MAG: protein kinase [Chitinivibrionales bacterium]|nr:protein kinase [Chitinivibrionales bacterium]